MQKIKLAVYAALFISISSFSQQPIKDTLIDSTIYHYAHYYLNGKLNALSQYKDKNQGGEWIYYDKAGDEEWSGTYNKKGKKEGAWWYRKKEIIYFKNGRETGKKGSGCKGCVF